MILSQSIKHLLLFLLIFLLGAQTTFSKTELVLPQHQVSFFVNQNLNNLEKELPPNIGFLKEKVRFVVSEGVSVQNTYIFSGGDVSNLAEGGSDWFSLSNFKNPTPKISSGSKLTYLKKTDFINDGYKVKPSSGSSVKSIIDDIVATGDNLGLKTESAVREIMESKGYTWVDGKYGSNNGYDGVFVKGTLENPSEIIIIESKQFKYTNNTAGDLIEHSGVNFSPPSATTPLPAQMSDDWIQYVQNKIRAEANLITDPVLKQQKLDFANMIRDFDYKITKYVSAVDKTQGEINFLKLGNY